jgi:Carboxypeptidase regulatory-like domain
VRRFRLSAFLLAGVTALVLGTQLAGAQSVERIRISDPAREAHQLPAGLLVELASPTRYERQSASGDSGRWVGPRYEQSGHPENAGLASLDWSVSFDERDGDAEAVAHANIVHTDWARDQKGGLSVPHLVGTQDVGTILGAYEMVKPSTTGDARFEGVLAFPLDTNLHAVIRFEALNPPDDTFVVGGSSIASSWNRGQVLVALAGAQLQGNLPPKIVAARSFERGRIVRGKVVDRFLDAVIGARVSLERSSGGSWTRVASGKTSPRGFYSLGAKRRGTYRVTVRMDGFTATSREIRAGTRTK